MSAPLVTLAQAVASGRRFRRFWGDLSISGWDGPGRIGTSCFCFESAIDPVWQIEPEPERWPTPWKFTGGAGGWAIAANGRGVDFSQLTERIVAAVNAAAEEVEEHHMTLESGAFWIGHTKKECQAPGRPEKCESWGYSRFFRRVPPASQSPSQDGEK